MNKPIAPKIDLMNKPIAPKIDLMNKPIAAKYTFYDEADSCANVEAIGNWLTVEVCDAGGGNYLVLKTERWAMGREDLQAFIKRLEWCLDNCKEIE